MKLLNASLIAAAIACAAFAPAHAADNMDLDVTITSDKSCDVTSTGDVAFGNALASAGTVDAVGGLVTVQCTIGVPYDVALNAGNNGGSDVGARQMLHTNGTDAIAYQLYSDAGRSQVWGNTVDTNTVEGTGTGFGGPAYNRTHPIFARATIPGESPVGTYSDVITATVVF